MNPFGSREDDPLLQNDPLAPSDDEPTEESSTDGEPPTQSTSSNGEASPTSPEQDAPPPDDESEDSHSVFERTSPGDGDPHAPVCFHKTDDALIIYQWAPEGSTGQLTALNSVLDEGWRLDRVELREELPPPAESNDAPPPSEQPSPIVTFVLREPE
jgi:hypothetical protein